MKVTSVKIYNNQNLSPAFGSGVTNLFSDFDGTFMPHEYNHDVFCRNGCNKRNKFLKNKKPFENYFNSFKKLFGIIKSDGDDKLNFVVTSGRNRPEYNYFMKRIREDGLSIPVPDYLIVNNGGDVYTPSPDFFNSCTEEMFSSKNFVPQKRDKIKEISGFNGEKAKNTVLKYFKQMAENNPDIKNKADVKYFNVETDGYFYGGKELSQRLHSVCPNGEDFLASRDDGALGLHFSMSDNFAQNGKLEEAREAILSKFKNAGTEVVAENHLAPNGKISSLKILPKINGKALDKNFDTSELVKNILKNNSNDLVIVAGDGCNDFSMLDMFEYVQGTSGKRLSAENLKKIYKLPLISIYVDNSSKNGKSVPINGQISLDVMDEIFNSDGNVRFIHVNPSDPAKPQNLRDAVVVAVKEYSKRNEEFRNNLSSEMRELIENVDYDYPVNRNTSKILEEKLGVSLWSPVEVPKKVVNSAKKTKADKRIFIAMGVIFGFLTFLGIRKSVKNKKISNEKTKNLNETKACGIYLSLPDTFKGFKGGKI